MSIEITEKVNKQEWENFLLTFPKSPFLQSSCMQDLHKGVNQDSFIVVIKKEEKIIGGSLVIIVRAKRGDYLYLPYGPILQTEGSEYFEELTKFLKKKARVLNIDFIRSSPFIELNEKNNSTFVRSGWKKAPIHMLAENLWFLDITKSEEEIMKGMRKTMRNLIRRATKEGVTIEISKNAADVEHFINIHQDTVQRHKFTPYTNDYFRAQVNTFLQNDDVLIFLAKYQNKVIAAAVIMFYGNMASYHHGASLSEYYKIPASYLLQWTAIQEAKKRGCKTYNFWGIIPEGKELSPILKKKHPFLGVTKFKKGFGGYQFDIMHCQDYPITLKYYFLTKPIEIVRRIKRGFYY